MEEQGAIAQQSPGTVAFPAPIPGAGSSEHQLLTGVHERTLDEKGRLVIPAAFAYAFAQGVAVVPWPGPCVALLPTAEFLAIHQRMRSQQSSGMVNPRLAFSFAANAHHAQPDSQRRVLIPEPVRVHARIDGVELTVVGQVRRLELWAPEASGPVVEDGSIGMDSYVELEGL